jgi:hypothetical protein
MKPVDHHHSSSSPLCQRSTAAALVVSGICVIALGVMMLYALGKPSSSLKCLVSHLGNQGNVVASLLTVIGVITTAAGFALALSSSSSENNISKDKSRNADISEALGRSAFNPFALPDRNIFD